MDPSTTAGEDGSGDKSEEKADEPQWRSPIAHSVLNRTRAIILGASTLRQVTTYRQASDIEAFRGESAADHHHLAFNHRPSQVVIIGVARWFGRTVAQRIVRHVRSNHRGGGGQQLLTLDLVMFLLTEGHALEHCSIEIYVSHFPSYSKLFMEDLETQCRDVGKALQSFDVKYAAVWDAESLKKTFVLGCRRRG
ncbi:hypothetical protein MTO96_000766 [Rhipicephalus appendiculatus]